MPKALPTLHPGTHIQRARPVDVNVLWADSGRRFTPKPSDPNIQELVAELIRDGRQLQPCGCRLDPAGNLILIWGFRRWLAISHITQNHLVPTTSPLNLLDIVIVQDPAGKPLGERDAYIYTLVENAERQELTPLDKAHAAASLRDNFGYTMPEIAGFIKVNRSQVYRLLKLLDLPYGVQCALRDGDITQADAIKLAEDLEALGTDGKEEEAAGDDLSQEPTVTTESRINPSFDGLQVVDTVSNETVLETPSHSETKTASTKSAADRTEYKPRSGKLMLAELGEWAEPRHGGEVMVPHRILQAMLKYAMGLPGHGPQWLANQVWIETGCGERAPLEE